MKGRICCRPRRPSSTVLFVTLTGLVASAVYALWYGMNSDRDNVHPFLTQVIPAGHCTCQTSTTFECGSCIESALSRVAGPSDEVGDWKFKYGRDDKNEGLSEAQCNASFPGLFEDSERATRYWRDGIPDKKLDGIKLENGMARAMIYDGDLYVIGTKAKGEDHRRKIVGSLSAMHRALVATPTRQELPKIEFVFSVEDRVDDVLGTNSDVPVWVIARRASEESVWLMPDFGLWAWQNVVQDASNDLGPYSQVVDTIEARERDDMAWEKKERKIVWRGKLSFAPKLRRMLLDQSRDKPWADVKETEWDARTNYLSPEEQCKYMFVAHAEGRSYSASMKYRQACRSIVVAHKLQFIQHHHYLLVNSGPQQNYVEVERDWSDLGDKVTELIEDPNMARKIAENNIHTFRERYLTQAAEACYWRALWRAYGSVSPEPKLKHEEKDGGRRRGLRYESFLLLESNDMLNYHTF